MVSKVKSCSIFYAEMQFKTFRDPKVVILENDPFGQVYKDLSAQHLVLKKVPICEFCGAIRFPG